jgi:hypothetical protein
MKPRYDSINTIEVVQVRLFDTNDGPKVVGVFHREAGSWQHPLQATLYQSPTIRNDWSICFWRADSGDHGLKSPEAVRCAEVLRSIGFVDHAVWQQVTESELGKITSVWKERLLIKAKHRRDRRSEKSIKKPLEEIKTIVPRNR